MYEGRGEGGWGFGDCAKVSALLATENLLAMQTKHYGKQQQTNQTLSIWFTSKLKNIYVIYFASKDLLLIEVHVPQWNLTALSH